MRKSLRFTILERDGFRCRYCGRAASETVTLQVDHIHPRKLGGLDDPTNLATACWDCNSGKGARKLRPIPPRRPRGRRTPSVAPEVEAEEQAREWEALVEQFPVGSHCSTPLKIAAIGQRFGIASYASAYRFVKDAPRVHPVPMPPQRRSDANWMRVVRLDPYHQRSLADRIERAIG